MSLSDDGGRPDLRYLVGVWILVAAFGLIAIGWSLHVGVGFRDPGGRLLVGRVLTTLRWLLVALVADVAWSWWRAGAGRSLRTTLRVRLAPGRLALIASGLAAYHLVYFCYRNLKSWDAFNTPHDEWLARIDRAILGGRSAAVVLHDLLGTGTAAHVLAAFYQSFNYGTAAAVVVALVLARTARRGYVFLTAAMWVWILGTASYYAIPSLGPFASAPQDFVGLPHTASTASWAALLEQRQEFLANPGGGGVVGISAFASLHTGFTAMTCLMAFYYGHRWLGAALTAYLVVIMVATIYWGWHFLSDDVAGLAVGAASVALAHLMIRPPAAEVSARAGG